MIALATAFVIVQQGSYFQQTFTGPTGNNGWEEYLMAADVVRGPDAARVIYDTDTIPLVRDRAAVAKYKRACDLIRIGNAKPLVYPWKVDPREIIDFPMYAELKVVGTLFLAEARVLASDGKPDVAARSIRDALKFGRRIAGKTIVGGLVSVAVQSIAMKALNDNLHRLTSSGARLLLGEFDRAARERSVLESLYFEELKWEKGIMRDYILHPDAISDEVPEELKQLSAAQVEAAAKAARAEIDRLALQLRAMFNREERFWSAPDVASDNLAANFALQMVLPTPTHAMVRNLTQLRLAAVHCRVMEYRRLHGDFPKGLGALNAPEAIYDRASGGPFYYASLSPQSYLLYSLGNSETGRIDLVYRRQTE